MAQVTAPFLLCPYSNSLFPGLEFTGTFNAPSPQGGEGHFWVREGDIAYLFSPHFFSQSLLHPTDLFSFYSAFLTETGKQGCLPVSDVLTSCLDGNTLSWNEIMLGYLSPETGRKM